jgi:hypothetical protein
MECRYNSVSRIKPESLGSALQLETRANSDIGLPILTSLLRWFQRFGSLIPVLPGPQFHGTYFPPTLSKQTVAAIRKCKVDSLPPTLTALATLSYRGPEVLVGPGFGCGETVRRIQMQVPVINRVIENKHAQAEHQLKKRRFELFDAIGIGSICRYGSTKSKEKNLRGEMYVAHSGNNNIYVFT